MNFNQAFEVLIGHEGGLIDHPSDPGGLTNFGISKRSYPGEDIKGMTLARAKELHRRDFWGPAGCDALPDALRFQVFDAAVNSGVRAAVRMLQACVGETEDGILGPRTLQAVQSMPTPRLAARFNGRRLAFMTTLSNWPAFSRGWARRIASNLQEV